MSEMISRPDVLIITETEEMANEVVKRAKYKKQYKYNDILCDICEISGIEVIQIRWYGIAHYQSMLELLTQLDVKRAYILGYAMRLCNNIQVGDIIISSQMCKIQSGKIDSLSLVTEYKSLTNMPPFTIGSPTNTHNGVIAYTDRILTPHDLLPINRKIRALSGGSANVIELLENSGIHQWLIISTIVDEFKDMGAEALIYCKVAVQAFVDYFETFVAGISLPRVTTYFICSTCYDLKDLRSELANYLKQNNKVLWSESDEFPVDFRIHSHDVCLHNVALCDHLIVIIDRRYGGIYAGKDFPQKDISITQYEIETALSLEKPVTTFVRSNVWNERATYKKNKKANIDIIPAHVDDVRVFDLIDFINQSGQNWIYQFENSVDLKVKLENILQL